MPVLYRKYRSQRFAEVVGQEPITRTLQNAVKTGSVAHAYLFTGSRGVGKTSVARILAKAVNCLHLKDGDADASCEICLAIAANNFLDLVEIDAASNTGVENVRELIEHVKFQPSRGKYKVFIIDEVHMLSKAAFNALLKTLEEPPQHAIFILATTDIQKVPETIISRTQRFDFRKITEAQILQHLQVVAKQEKLQLSDDILRLITTSAQGAMRDALSLLDKVAALGPKITLEEAQSLLGITSTKLSEQLLTLIANKDAAALPSLFDELLNNGTDFSALNRNLLEYLRKLLVYKIAGDKASLDLLPEDMQTLQALAAKLAVPDLMLLIRLFLRAYKELAATPSPELPLLLAAIEASLKGPLPAAEVLPRSQTSIQPAKTTSLKASSTPSQPAHTTIETEAILPEVKSEPTLQETPEPILEVVTSDEVQAFWPAVIEKIKTVNSPLATLLKNSPVQEVAGSTITVGVKYLFHKEHLESKKNYSLITGVITEISGKHVRLAVKITKAIDQSLFSGGLDAVGSALKVFGGELVE
jgi:DNA polymerase III subunit gamma/tau